MPGRVEVTAPGPTGGHMLRSLRSIMADPLEFLAAQWRTHGDVIQFPVPSPPTYMVSHPDDVRQVLVTRARQMSKDTIQYRALSAVTGHGLLTSDGARWREHRRVVQPAFHPRTLPGVAGHTASAGLRLLERLSEIPEGGLVDVDAEVMAVALEVVGDSLFGHGLAPAARRLSEATLTALDEVVSIARTPLRAPRWIPTAGNRRMAASLKELDGAVRAILDSKALDSPADPPDLVDLLRSSELDERATRDEIVTFLVAGHETVASALTWALVLLGTHPGIADLVADEARAVLGADHRMVAGATGGADGPGNVGADDKAGPAVDMATLARLTTSRAVIDEAMRLHPPAWLITRSTSTPLELHGYHLPAGSLVIISPWIVHRHPEAWVDADRFRPERFLTQGAGAATSAGASPESSGAAGGAAGRRAAFIPFGAGPRMCIGRDFAYAESVLALSLLCRAVRLEPSGAPVRPLPLVTIRPDRPPLMRVIPRAAATPGR